MIGRVHGGGSVIIRQEVIKNDPYTMIYTEYDNGYVTISARGDQTVYAPNSQVMSRIEFPLGVSLDANTYSIQAMVGHNGSLVKDLMVMADAAGNPKYDSQGFSYSWKQTAKYYVTFMFFIQGFKI